MNSPLAMRMLSQPAPAGKAEPKIKSGATATGVSAILTSRKNGIGKVKQQQTHARKALVKQKPVKVLNDPLLKIDKLDQPAILQVAAKVVDKPVALVPLPIFEALFANLEGIHIVSHDLNSNIRHD